LQWLKVKRTSKCKVEKRKGNGCLFLSQFFWPGWISFSYSSIFLSPPKCSVNECKPKSKKKKECFLSQSNVTCFLFMLLWVMSNQFKLIAPESKYEISLHEDTNQWWNLYMHHRTHPFISLQHIIVSLRICKCYVQTDWNMYLHCRTLTSSNINFISLLCNPESSNIQSWTGSVVNLFVVIATSSQYMEPP